MSTSYDLGEFLARASAKLARDQAYANWHLLAFHVGGIDLPYDPTTNYINLNVWSETDDKIDEKATIDALAKVAQFARDCDGVTVEKNYSSDFELRLIVSREHGDDLYLHYYAEREAVCTKRVVGSELVPEKITPAYEKEIIEWDCEPISLLGREVDA